MRAGILMAVILMAGIPGFCQVEPTATGGAAVPDADEQMKMPPPVNGIPYPGQTASDKRSNFLSFGIGVTSAYFDNVLLGIAAQPVGDEMYSISPGMTYNTETPRQSRNLVYTSGYTFYQHSTALNYLDQAATATFQERFTHRVTLNLSDSFVQSSGLFNQSYGGAVSGAVTAQQQLIIAPFAKQITNTASAELSVQYGRDAMLGASFNAGTLSFPDISQAQGLNNSQLYGGSAFWNRRLSQYDYLGAIYQVQRMTTSPVPAVADIEAVWGFYTHYFNRAASFSIAAGPGYGGLSAPGVASSHSWTPGATFSMGWQASNTNFALSYMHGETPMIGFPGIFSTDTGLVSVTQKFHQSWNASASGSYGNFSNLVPQFPSGLPGGHSAMGSISIQYVMSPNLTTQGGYTRLHQSYSSLTTFAQNPDSDEVFISVVYQFRKSIGR